MMLEMEFRPRMEGDGRVEIHHDTAYTPALVRVIVYSGRPWTGTVGFTRYQAAQLCLALGDLLPSLTLLGPLDGADEGRAAGALGKNTDTDSHPAQRAQRSGPGDCGLSASEPMLPLVLA